MCGFPGFFVWMNQQKLGSKGKCSAGTEYGNFLQNKRKFEWIGQFIGQSKMPGNIDFTGARDMERAAQIHQVMWIYWSTVD